jgi:hypothetical protein
MLPKRATFDSSDKYRKIGSPRRGVLDADASAIFFVTDGWYSLRFPASAPAQPAPAQGSGEGRPVMIGVTLERLEAFPIEPRMISSSLDTGAKEELSIGYLTAFEPPNQ